MKTFKHKTLKIKKKTQQIKINSWLQTVIFSRLMKAISLNINNVRKY